MCRKWISYLQYDVRAGPRLIGLLFNWGLLGVLTTQVDNSPQTKNRIVLTCHYKVYIYHINFPKDRRILKLLGIISPPLYVLILLLKESLSVYVVYLLDWAQTCSATYDAFQWFVYGWGVVPTLFLRFTGFLNVPLLSSIIGALVQASISTAAEFM